jgi:hypothetical protein
MIVAVTTDERAGRFLVILLTSTQIIARRKA